MKDLYEKEYDVVSIKIHEKYWTGGYGYDIALLKLASPAPLIRGGVWKACLPKQEERVPGGKRVLFNW